MTATGTTTDTSLILQLQLQLRVLWGNPNFSNFKFWNSDPGDRCAWLRRVAWCPQIWEIPKFTPSNLLCGFLDWCFWFSGTSGTSGTLVFWYFVKLGFHFPGYLATKKLCWGCQSDPWGRVHFSRWFWGWNTSSIKIPNFHVRQQWRFHFLLWKMLSSA